MLRAVGDCGYSPDLVEYFQDFAALNRVLSEEHLTAELFLLIDAQGSERAERLYYVAEPALVKGGHFRHCNKYLAPERDFERASDLLRIVREFESHAEYPAGPDGDVPPKLAETFFAQKMTTLIALLAVNGRNDEAATIAGRAKATLPDESFHAAVERALAGQVPEPWP